jgi:hypothetical protein
MIILKRIYPSEEEVIINSIYNDMVSKLDKTKDDSSEISDNDISISESLISPEYRY